MSEGKVIRFSLKQGNPNKIPVIKAIRSATGLGLKESKYLVDQAYETNATFTVGNTQVMPIEQELISLGVEVCQISDNAIYKQALEELATTATLAGDYYVAKRILNLLEELF